MTVIATTPLGSPTAAQRYEPTPHEGMHVQQFVAPPSLDIRVHHINGEIVVEEIRTGIFGRGGTYADALSDFDTAIREHIEVLSRQAALSDELAHQLAYLRERASA